MFMLYNSGAAAHNHKSKDYEEVRKGDLRGAGGKGGFKVNFTACNDEVLSC